MEAQRQQLLAQWEAKLNRAQEAAEAANAAHIADREAVELAASQAVAAAAGEGACHASHTLLACMPSFLPSATPWTCT